jgi:acetyl esterase
MTDGTIEAAGAVGPLDPEMERIVAIARKRPRGDPRTTPVAEQRRLTEIDSAMRARTLAAVATRDLRLPGLSGTLPARLYGDAAAVGDGLLLGLHGGGWTVGSVASWDDFARELGVRFGLPVLSLDYRLAPEHPHPAALDDALAAVDFVLMGGLGQPVAADRIAVVGDSSGAHLALATLLAGRDSGRPRLAAGILSYGCYAPDFDTASHRAFGADGRYLLSSEQMRWYWENLLGELPLDSVGTVAPLRMELGGLPPLFLDMASHDVLADDTRRLAARLAAIGAPHRFRPVEGVVHGYIRHFRDVAAARETIAAAARWLPEVAGIGRPNLG